MNEDYSWLKMLQKGYDESIRYQARKDEVKEKIETIKIRTSSISDTKLRKLLERDCEELVIISENRALKSVLIISGSIIEAILLEEVKKDHNFYKQLVYIL